MIDIAGATSPHKPRSASYCRVKHSHASLAASPGAIVSAATAEQVSSGAEKVRNFQ